MAKTYTMNLLKQWWDGFNKPVSHSRERYEMTRILDENIRLKKKLKEAKSRIITLCIHNEILMDDLSELKSKFQ